MMTEFPRGKLTDARPKPNLADTGRSGAMDNSEPARPRNFIEEFIEADLREGKCPHVHTRFPPEPNGYLHIGHAKSICLNFGLARKYGGRCNLRFDDTNPEKEDVEYVDSIMEDVRWLGFDWEDRLYYASDYFEQIYEWAVMLIRKGKAYVCDMSAEEVAATRGTPTEPGRESPYREPDASKRTWTCSRGCETGSSPTGPGPCARRSTWPRPTCTCATRCSTASSAPITTAPATSGASTRCTTSPTASRTTSRASRTPSAPWSSRCTGRCTTGSSTRSRRLGRVRPRQIEFARLNLTYTVMSKRKLLQLVKDGLRQRLGRPPHAHHIRTPPPGLHAGVDPRLRGAHRRGQAGQRGRHGAAGALHPRRPEPSRPEAHGGAQPAEGGHRELPRRAGGGNRGGEQSRGRSAWARERSLSGGSSTSSGTISWRSPRRSSSGFHRGPRCACDTPTSSSARASLKIIMAMSPSCGAPWTPGAWSAGRAEGQGDHPLGAGIGLRPGRGPAVRPVILKGRPLRRRGREGLPVQHEPGFPEDGDALLEPSLKTARPGDTFQFERLGYFCADPDSRPGNPVFNRTVGLRDTWARISGKDR